MRGLKPKSGKRKCYLKGVASFTDAWIETMERLACPLLVSVASFTDAWIETKVMVRLLKVLIVASFTDAWIETRQSS